VFGLIGQLARFAVQMTIDGIAPGAIGVIFAAMASEPESGARVRVEINDYRSRWLLPGEYEIWSHGAWRAPDAAEFSKMCVGRRHRRRR
jgi:hypothetical protein